MRAIPPELDVAQNARSRTPLARVTVRDVRLRFSHYLGGRNPWDLLDTDLQGGQSYVYGDAVTLDNGHVLRVWADQTGDLRLQDISDPAIPSQWGHSLGNPWGIISAQPNLGAAGVENPGLVASGNNARLFYDAGTHDDGSIGLHYRDLSEGWATPHFTGINLFGLGTYAPVSFTELYVFLSDFHGIPYNLGLVHVQKVGGTWVSQEAPFRIYKDKSHFVTYSEYNSMSFFDAFTLNGINHIVYTFGDAGHCYCLRHANGVWSEPRLLIPDDATRFVGYRATVIAGRAYLTGRVTRANDPAYSPAWDAYLSTADGLNWSALARSSFVCQPEVRGKLLLSGQTLYYAGINNIWAAPAGYTLGQDPISRKLVLTDRLVSVHQSFPAAGLSPATDLTLANADDALAASTVLVDGSEAWVEVGYQTSAGPQMVVTQHLSLDSVQLGHGDGDRQLAVSGRAVSAKNLKDWVSPFYWTLPSQLRYFDACENTNTLKPAQGTWSADTEDLATNGSFETDTSGWTTVITAATGTAARSNAHASLGTWSEQIDKTGGAATDPWGVQRDFAAVANATYRISVDLFVSQIAGGAIEWKLRVDGAGLGPEGADLALEAGGSDVTLSFQTLAVEVPVVAAGTLTISVQLSNCLTGTAFVDNLVIIQEGVGYLTYADQAEQAGLVISTTPFAAGDFDVSGDFVRLFGTAAHLVNFGLVGQYVDPLNYNAFILGNTGVAALVAVRAGAQQVLAAVSYTLDEGVTYSLRLVHRGGHFWCYIKTAALYGWLDPLIEFHWGDNNTPGSNLCNTDDGTGPVGATVFVRPYRFLALAFDEAATSITAGAPGDLAAFPSAGTVICEQEQMTYTGLSGLVLSGLTRGANSTTAAPHPAGARVRLFNDDHVRLDNWQVADTEPNYTTESLIQRVCAMAGSFKTQFSNTYPRPGTADPSNVGQLPDGFNWVVHWLPADIDQKNLDLTFDWSCSTWGLPDYSAGVGVLVRAETRDYATAHAYLIHLGYLGPDVYYAGLHYLDVSGVTSPIDEFRLIQVPTGTGPHRFRVVVRDDWLALYCDDALMGTFHDTRLSAQSHNYVALISRIGDTAFDNVRIPELSEWRDTAWVDNEAVGMDVLDTVILDDRPIYMISRADDTLRFSLFDTRDQMINPATLDGSFGDILYTDQLATQDTDLVSMLRIYAVTILETLDPDLARDAGFVFAARQMPRAENLAAASYFPRIFRRAKEVHGARTEELPGNVALEVEDEFVVSVTPQGSNLPINTTVIVNDLELTFGEASLVMKLGLRTHQ